MNEKLEQVYVTQPLTPKNAASEIEKAIFSIFTEKMLKKQRIEDLNRENHLRTQQLVMHSGNWHKILWR